METKIAKEWRIQIRKHGLSAIRTSLMRSKRMVRLEIKRKIPEEIEDLSTEYKFSDDLDDGDIPVITVYRKRNSSDRPVEIDVPLLEEAIEFDDDIESTIGANNETDSLMSDVENMIDLSKWTEKFRLRIQDVELIKHSGSKCKMTFFTRKQDQDQDFIFRSALQAEMFTQGFLEIKNAVKRRVQQGLSEGQRNSRLSKTYQLEILSGSNLRVVNMIKDSSDPICVARIGEREIYRTPAAFNTVNPVWENAKVKFSATNEELYRFGLSFEVHDFEHVFRGKSLGSGNLTIDQIADSSHDVIEMELNPDHYDDIKQGTLRLKWFEFFDIDKEPDVESQGGNNNVFSHIINSIIPEQQYPTIQTFNYWDVTLKDHGVYVIKKMFADENRRVSIEIEANDNPELDLDLTTLRPPDVVERLKPSDKVQFKIFLKGNDSMSQEDPSDFPGYSLYRKHRIQDVVILRRKRNKVCVQYQSFANKTHDFMFETIEAADHFVEAIQQFKSFFTVTNDSDTNEITYLLDIVSASDLRVANTLQNSSDPSVRVRIGSREILKTETIFKSLNPIWTWDTCSLTTFKVTPNDLDSYGLSFEVFDTQFAKLVPLGHAHLDSKTIYDSIGTVIDMELDSEKTKYKNQGSLRIEIREATSYDISFVERGKPHFHEFVNLKTNLVSPLRFIKPSNRSEHFVEQIASKFVGNESRDLSILDDLVLQPSQSWIEAGSGKLGHVFVEVLSCDNLESDNIANVVNLIDPFVTIVYEDVAISTDVVYNTVNPRFLPSSRRAFKFRMDKISSTLFIGVFSSNQATLMADIPIGRLTVDMHKFRPNTTYLMHYNLRTSNRVIERPVTGTITLRISMEYDEKQGFWDCLNPDTRNHLNTESSNEFSLIRYTVEGTYQDKYTQESLMGSLNELALYANSILDFLATSSGVLLWRSSHTFNIGCCDIHLPLRSIVLFIGAIAFTENPNYLPSLICFILGWVMLLSLESQRTRFKLWRRPRSYWELFIIAAFGVSYDVHVDRNETENFETEKTKSEKNEPGELEKLTSRFAGPARPVVEQAEQLEDLTTLKNMPQISLNVLVFVIKPLQNILTLIIRPLRALAKIIKWENDRIAFILTTACLLVGFCFIFVPWGFITKWTVRIIVWTVFGPWMKLVDIFVLNKPKDPQDIPKGLFMALLRAKRIKEKATKLKAFKQYLFGKNVYSTPGSNFFERFSDHPLPLSSAKMLEEGEVRSEKLHFKNSIYGYKLNVDMTPSSAHLEGLSSETEKTNSKYGSIE